LREMGRADLIGNGKKQLIPAWQPAGTGGEPSRGQPPKTGQIRTASTNPRIGQRPGRPPGKPAASRGRPPTRKP
jgi:Domain of unknown function (DUF3362)